MSSLEDILDSVASPQRLGMLRALKSRELSYTELLESAGMDKVRDAGRFTYHLKKLLSAGLVESDEGSRRYRLTQKGRLLLEYLERMEKELGSKAMMIVRRSQHIIEPFDRSKIAEALVREAGLTPKLAEEVSIMAEEKLKGLKVGYLTASLIRELVNSILLDMGLEEYRHKLTRVGMPVYDVSRLLKAVEESKTPWIFVDRASGAVSREYLVLDFLPRDVAEAHLSGRIDLHGLGGWLTSIYGMAVGGDIIDSLGRVLWVRKELLVESPRKNLDKLIILQKVVHPDTWVALKPENASTLARLEAPRPLRTLIMVDILSHGGDLHKVDEAVRRGGFKPIYYTGGRILPSGYKVGEGLIHSIASLNIPAAVLESGRDPGETMERVRELARLASQALSKALKLYRRLYGMKVSGAVALCGLYESARHLTGSPPSVSRESRSTMIEVIEAASQGVRRGSGGESISLVAKAPRSAARRMVKADTYRFGGKEVSRFTGVERDEYSWTPVPTWERFKSLEDRLSLEIELAGRFGGGYFMLFSKSRRARTLVKVSETMEKLSQGEVPPLSMAFQ